MIIEDHVPDSLFVHPSLHRPFDFIYRGPFLHLTPLIAFLSLHSSLNLKHSLKIVLFGTHRFHPWSSPPANSDLSSYHTPPLLQAIPLYSFKSPQPVPFKLRIPAIPR